MLRTTLSSLRFGLILITLVVLVPALGLLVYVADQAREIDIDEEKSKVLYLARLAATEESQIIQSTRQLLEHIAQAPEARGETSRAACDGMMAQQIKLHPQYDNLGVIGPDGIRFCSVLLPAQSADLSSRTYFRRAVETREFAVGDYQVGGSSGNAGIGFGYPVLDATGGIRAVVFATLSIKWLGKSLALAQLPPEATMTVVDSQGTMLAQFPDPTDQAGRQVAQAGMKEMLAQDGSGTYEGVGGDGIRRVWGFVPLQKTASGAMLVRVGMPVTIAYAGINRVYYRNLLLTAVAALLILVVAWAFGERLVMRPVKMLTAASRRVGKGDLGARTGLPHGDNEFGQLARVFDDMAGSIQSDNTVLDRLMKQQKEANQQLVLEMGDLEWLNGEITQLSRTSNVLRACQGVEEACAAVAQAGQILFPTEVAALYLTRPSRDSLEYKTGWGGTGTEAAALSPESCQALRSGQVYRYEPPYAGLPCEHVTAGAPAAPYLCVPLIAQGDILGLLHIRFPAPDETQAAKRLPSRLQVATTFAVQAGLALANLKLREVLKEQAIRDPLTGLHNRRFLEETLERELARAQRNKAPLALIMADVDHFKSFNDTYGHDAGDAVLRAVAKTLKGHIRGSDIACRFGGEEFTLVLPESALNAAHKKTEALRRTIASLALSHDGAALGTVTMSFGLAIFPEHGTTNDELIRAADKALYEAKSMGRNRVVAASTMRAPSLAA